MKQILDVAIQAARAAGALMLSERDAFKRIETKTSAVDLVTHVDLACDKLIREMIHAAFPEHVLLTEETYQAEAFRSIDWQQPVWIIDPIDGTTNYAHGFPHSAVSIAYTEQAQPLVGVIFDPFKQELFHSVKDAGSYLNGKPIHVSETKNLSEALLATGFAFRRDTDDYQDKVEEFFSVLRACRDVRRAGSAALDLAYVACGRLDGFYEASLSPWDVAAGILLVHEAGGQTASLATGEALNLSRMIQDVLATPPKLLAQLQSILS